MKKALTLFLAALCFCFANSQSLYFPPLTGNTWETITPESLGWCPERVDSLLNFLESQDSKAFIVLKDGKIVIEKYFGSFTQDSLWYWASAGKSLTSVLVGIAQEEGSLNIDSSSSFYMGMGWTSLTAPQERAIKVRHQLSMTTGLDDAAAGGADCTLPSCLVYKAAPGTRWAYHNGPYTLLDSVMHSATGMTLNAFVNQKIKAKTGMNGLYIKSGYNNVYVSNARSMARFGLLMLNKGKWNNQVVLSDTAYYHAMINSSQNINLSYGYLWWLAGKNSFMVPQSQFVFPGSAVPNAPADMFAALGKNGQIINVVPSQNLVLIRMGNPPHGESGLITNIFDNNIWGYMNNLICSSGIAENSTSQKISVFPNPATDVLYLNKEGATFDQVRLYDSQGKEIMNQKNCAVLSIESLQKGIYFLKLVKGESVYSSSFIKR